MEQKVDNKDDNRKRRRIFWIFLIFLALLGLILGITLPLTLKGTKSVHKWAYHGVNYDSKQAAQQAFLDEQEGHKYQQDGFLKITYDQDDDVFHFEDIDIPYDVFSDSDAAHMIGNPALAINFKNTQTLRNSFDLGSQKFDNVEDLTDFIQDLEVTIFDQINHQLVPDVTRTQVTGDAFDQNDPLISGLTLGGQHLDTNNFFQRSVDMPSGQTALIDQLKNWWENQIHATTANVSSDTIYSSTKWTEGTQPGGQTTIGNQPANAHQIYVYNGNAYNNIDDAKNAWLVDNPVKTQGQYDVTFGLDNAHTQSLHFTSNADISEVDFRNRFAVTSNINVPSHIEKNNNGVWETVKTNSNWTNEETDQWQEYIDFKGVNHTDTFTDQAQDILNNQNTYLWNELEIDKNNSNVGYVISEDEGMLFKIDLFSRNIFQIGTENADTVAGDKTWTGLTLSNDSAFAYIMANDGTFVKIDLNSQAFSTQTLTSIPNTTGLERLISDPNNDDVLYTVERLGGTVGEINLQTNVFTIHQPPAVSPTPHLWKSVYAYDDNGTTILYLMNEIGEIKTYDATGGYIQLLSPANPTSSSSANPWLGIIVVANKLYILSEDGNVKTMDISPISPLSDLHPDSINDQINGIGYAWNTLTIDPHDSTRAYAFSSNGVMAGVNLEQNNFVKLSASEVSNDNLSALNIPNMLSDDVWKAMDVNVQNSNIAYAISDKTGTLMKIDLLGINHPTRIGTLNADEIVKNAVPDVDENMLYWNTLKIVSWNGVKYLYVADVNYGFVLRAAINDDGSVNQIQVLPNAANSGFGTDIDFTNNSNPVTNIVSLAFSPVMPNMLYALSNHNTANLTGAYSINLDQDVIFTKDIALNQLVALQGGHTEGGWSDIIVNPNNEHSFFIVNKSANSGGYLISVNTDANNHLSNPTIRLNKGLMKNVLLRGGVRNKTGILYNSMATNILFDNKMVFLASDVSQTNLGWGVTYYTIPLIAVVDNINNQGRLENHKIATPGENYFPNSASWSKIISDPRDPSRIFLIHNNGNIYRVYLDSYWRMDRLTFESSFGYKDVRFVSDHDNGIAPTTLVAPTSDFTHMVEMTEAGSMQFENQLLGAPNDYRFVPGTVQWNVQIPSATVQNPQLAGTWSGVTFDSNLLTNLEVSVLDPSPTLSVFTVSEVTAFEPNLDADAQNAIMGINQQGNANQIETKYGSNSYNPTGAPVDLNQIFVSETGYFINDASANVSPTYNSFEDAFNALTFAGAISFIGDAQVYQWHQKSDPSGQTQTITYNNFEQLKQALLDALSNNPDLFKVENDVYKLDAVLAVDHLDHLSQEEILVTHGTALSASSVQNDHLNVVWDIPPVEWSTPAEVDLEVAGIKEVIV